MAKSKFFKYRGIGYEQLATGGYRVYSDGQASDILDTRQDALDLINQKIKPPKTKAILIRVTEQERLAIEMQAMTHGNGSVSEWVRAAALNYKP